MLSFHLNEINKTLPERFLEIVKTYPEQIAIQFENKKITYQQLQEESQKYSNFFVHQLGEKQTPVLVLVNSQKGIIPLLMGIVHAGHKYSVVFANEPVQRIKSILQDLEAPYLIIQDETLYSLAISCSTSNTKVLTISQAKTDEILPLKVKLNPDSNAVIIYTSGSTGEPKGILRTHRMIQHQAFTYQDQFGFGVNETILGIRPYNAGASLTELFAPLILGGTIVPFDIKEDGLGKLANILKVLKVSFLRPPIQMLRSFLETLPKNAMFPDIRYIFATGDVFYKKDVDKLRKVIPPEAIIVHQYAMSEAGILAVNKIGYDTPIDSEVISIGKPVKGKELFVQNEDGTPTPNEEIGEVFVRTRMQLPGYWRDEEKTKDNFVYNPQTGETVFATGDLGKVKSNGQIELVGRKDWRVKILGFSVDLSAIEHILMQDPNVKRAIVLALTDPFGQKRLVAYILPLADVVIQNKDLLNLVSQNLPSYMVPSFIITVSELPINSAGKVNRKLLPVPNWAERQTPIGFIPPRDAIEETLAQIWSKVLKVSQVGRNDNFFELGGDSLLALELILEIEKSINTKIPQQFFRSPTIASLVELLKTDLVTDVEKDYFSLKSQEKKKNNANKNNKRQIDLSSILKRLLNFNILLYIDRFIDFLVARYIVNKSYIEARDLSVQWSKNVLFQKILYGSKKKLLLKIQNIFPNATPLTSELFQMNIITNLNYGMSRYYDKSQRYTIGKVGALSNSKYKYWQSFANLIQQLPEPELLTYFPINGLEYFMQAYEGGKGVILISAHSISPPIRLYILTRMLNEEIPTISYHVPIRLSEHHQTPKDLSDEIALPMNSEIALFGQRLLMQGRAINIILDTSDPYGRSKYIPLGNRQYRIKTGFAELSLNTGAQIIPYYGGCLLDGRPELNFMPPFDAGSGTRTEQVENLVDQYASFLNYIWSQKPEVLHWRRVSRYINS